MAHDIIFTYVAITMFAVYMLIITICKAYCSPKRSKKLEVVLIERDIDDNNPILSKFFNF